MEMRSQAQAFFAMLPARRFGNQRSEPGRVTADGHKDRETRRAIEHRRDMLAIERQFRL